MVIRARDPARIGSIVDSIQHSGGIVLGCRPSSGMKRTSRGFGGQAERAFGPVTLLVCCAGSGGEPKPVVEESLDRSSW